VPRALWGFSCGVRLGEVGQSARPNRFASQDGWIFCVTAPSDQRSPPKCLTILAPGAKPDNMIVGRESRSGIAAVSGPGHAECLPAGRNAPLGLPENALDVAGRNTAAAPGFFPRVWGPGAGRQRHTESENIASQGCGGYARVRPRDLFPVRNPGFRRWSPVPIWAAPPES
jgi:hypothetical protein